MHSLGGTERDQEMMALLKKKHQVVLQRVGDSFRMLKQVTVKVDRDGMCASD